MPLKPSFVVVVVPLITLMSIAPAYAYICLNLPFTHTVLVLQRCGRVDDQIELLQQKIRLIDEGFGGRPMKLARSKGKNLYVSIDQEKAR